MRLVVATQAVVAVILVMCFVPAFSLFYHPVFSDCYRLAGMRPSARNREVYQSCIKHCFRHGRMQGSASWVRHRLQPCVESYRNSQRHVPQWPQQPQRPQPPQRIPERHVHSDNCDSEEHQEARLATTTPIRVTDPPRHTRPAPTSPVDSGSVGSGEEEWETTWVQTTERIRVTDPLRHIRPSTASPRNNNEILQNEILIEVDPTSGTPTWTPPVVEEIPNGIPQCRDHECPSYGLVERINDVVIIREVAAGMYATKKSTSCNMLDVRDDMYMPLRRFFEGDNLENVVIPTTTPVLQLAVRPDLSPGMCNFTYQTSFYLPKAYQATPPTPLEESIAITETDETLYFVMRFHEDPTPKTAFEKYSELKALIDETGHCYRRGEFRLAFYDDPFRPLPHLYEMWIPVDEHCNDVGDEEDFDNETDFQVEDDWNLIFP